MSDCLGTAGDARIGSDIDLVGLVPSISINRCLFMFSYGTFFLLFNFFSFENDGLSAARVVNLPDFRSSLWRASNPGHEFSHGSMAQGLLREQDAQTIRIQRSGSFRHFAQYNFF